MSKELGQFDLEERLIDFAVCIIRIAESLPKSIFVASIKTANPNKKKTL